MTKATSMGVGGENLLIVLIYCVHCVLALVACVLLNALREILLRN